MKSLPTVAKTATFLLLLLVASTELTEFVRGDEIDSNNNQTTASGSNSSNIVDEIEEDPVAVPIMAPDDSNSSSILNDIDDDPLPEPMADDVETNQTTTSDNSSDIAEEIEEDAIPEPMTEVNYNNDTAATTANSSDIVDEIEEDPVPEPMTDVVSIVETGKEWWNSVKDKLGNVTSILQTTVECGSDWTYMLDDSPALKAADDEYMATYNYKTTDEYDGKEDEQVETSTVSYDADTMAIYKSACEDNEYAFWWDMPTGTTFRCALIDGSYSFDMVYNNYGDCWPDTKACGNYVSGYESFVDALSHEVSKEGNDYTCVKTTTNTTNTPEEDDEPSSADDSETESDGGGDEIESISDTGDNMSLEDSAATAFFNIAAAAIAIVGTTAVVYL